MFKKLLIANRGEIAVRIVRTCREMGIRSVALYAPEDGGSLHVRLADECVQLDSADSFTHPDTVLRIAQMIGADAIHPGYGFVAEVPEFVERCEQAGIVFVGPTSTTLRRIRNKLEALRLVSDAGIPTVAWSSQSFGVQDDDLVSAEAAAMGFPIVIKSCTGGRGRGERIVYRPQQLARALRRARDESNAVFHDRRVYLEKAIVPAHQINVQIVGDTHGNRIHLGEREGSVQLGHIKLIEESPAPLLNDTLRGQMFLAALKIGELFDYTNLGSVEFLLDGDGNWYFTELKGRIQVEHPLTEMRANVDLVREQIQIAAGRPLSKTQAQVQLRDHALLCRVRADDPMNNHRPSPGLLERVRFPGGMGVRVDSFAHCRCQVPADYDALIAKVTTWDETRDGAIGRMQTALAETRLTGIPTNIPALRQILETPHFADGSYTTDLVRRSLSLKPTVEAHEEDIAVIAAMLYVQRNQAFVPSTPVRFGSGWHRVGRRFPT